MTRQSLTYLTYFIAAVLAVVFMYNVFSIHSRTSLVANTTAPANISATKSDPVTEIKKPLPKNNVINTVANIVNTNSGGTEIMAWIYPGDPTCNAKLEYSDGRKIDILKPEYFTVSDSGKMILMTEQNSGCNGYSAQNVADLKKYSNEQYATFSSNYAVSMDSFLTGALADDSDVNTLVSFVNDNKMTGVEIDFEDFGGWNADMYSKYKQFITNLGNALHKNNKKLMIDGPATSNKVEEDWYVWRYADFNSLPVDRVVVMTYDYQFDQGVGQPVSPISWIQNTISWTLGEFPDKTKISFGIPSYGYKGIAGTQKFSLLTYDQIKKEPGFDTATRDSASYEMTWQNGNNVYFYQDSESMSEKLKAIQDAGITSVSVWHLVGNLWFAKN
jgi:spore germination protein YaaH